MHLTILPTPSTRFACTLLWLLDLENESRTAICCKGCAGIRNCFVMFGSDFLPSNRRLAINMNQVYSSLLRVTTGGLKVWPAPAAVSIGGAKQCRLKRIRVHKLVALALEGGNVKVDLGVLQTQSSPRPTLCPKLMYFLVFFRTSFNLCLLGDTRAKCHESGSGHLQVPDSDLSMRGHPPKSNSHLSALCSPAHLANHC